MAVDKYNKYQEQGTIEPEQFGSAADRYADLSVPVQPSLLAGLRSGIAALLQIPVARLVLAGSVLFGILAWLSVFLFMNYDREQTLANARAQASNLSRAFSEYVVATVGFIDHILAEVAEAYEEDPADTDLQHIVQEYPMLRGAIIQLAVAAPDGRVVKSSLPLGPEPVMLGDREHFRLARSNEIFISQPVIGRVSGRESIQFSRRIESKEGRLLGVAILSFDPSHFTGYFRRVDVGRNGAITLMRDDLRIVSRATASGQPTPSGARFEGPEVRRALAQSVSAVFEARNPIDGVVRIHALQSLVPFPLIEVVELSVDEVLAGFYLRRNVIFAAMVALSSILAVILYWSLRNLVREHDYHLVLTAKDRELEIANSRMEHSLSDLISTQSELERQGAELAESVERQYLLNERLKEEIAERKRAEDIMRHMAQHDALTGLPNRRLFMELAENALALARRSKQPMAIVNIDIDGFKGINDTLGHEKGDELLRQISNRYTSRLRESDVVARVGGDEFVALLPIINNARDAEQVARDIVALTAVPFDLGVAEGHVGASVGIAIYPKDGEHLDELMRQADDAMYRAKKSGKNQFRFAVPQQE